MQPPNNFYRNMQSNTQQGVPGSGNFNGNPNTVYNRQPGPFYNPSQPWGPNNGLQYARQPDASERMYNAGYTNVRPSNAGHYLQQRGNQPMQPPIPNVMPKPGGNAGHGNVPQPNVGAPNANKPMGPMYGQGQNPWWQSFGFPTGQNTVQPPPNVMPKPGMEQGANKPAPNTQPTIYDRLGQMGGGYDDYARNFQPEATPPGMMRDMSVQPGRDVPLSREEWERQQRGGNQGWDSPYTRGGTPAGYRPDEYGIWGGSQQQYPYGGINFRDERQSPWGQLQELMRQGYGNQRGGQQDGYVPSARDFMGGYNQPPFPQFNPGYSNQMGYGYSNDSGWGNGPWRGGQNAGLSRYAPPMFDMGGRSINEGRGGYSYNLPNAYGPYPMFSQFGMGGRFGLPQWGGG